MLWRQIPTRYVIFFLLCEGLFCCFAALLRRCVAFITMYHVPVTDRPDCYLELM